jgi:phosphoglycolate phosphatase-like HAD superfamily hydrolase
LYNTVIFDVDGTLIDTERALIGSLQKLLMEYHDKEYQEQDLSFVLGVPGTVSLLKLGIKNADEANAKWNLYMKDLYHTVRVFDHIKSTLGKLKSSGAVTGIVTSKTRQELINDFVPFGLSDYLGHSVCADDTKKHKPSPEPLLKFLEITGVAPETSIYIGDTIYDMQCAADAGVDFGLALWGAKEAHRINAKYKLSNPYEVLNLITV